MKEPWWILVNKLYEYDTNNNVITTEQSKTKPYYIVYGTYYTCIYGQKKNCIFPLHKPDYLFHSIHYACITNQQCNLNGKLLRKETAVVDADVIDYQTMTAFTTAFERLLWSLYTFPVSTTVACYWMILIEKNLHLNCHVKNHGFQMVYLIVFLLHC